MFALLAPLLEGRRRTIFIGTVVAAAVLIPLYLWFAQPQIETFRGLSGVDTAIFGALCVLLCREMVTHRDRKGLAILAFQVTAFAGKLTYEHVTGRCFLVHNEGWSPVTSAHIVGVAIGVGCASAFAAWHRSRRREEPRCTPRLDSFSA
jgi:membrane associated rhomboid family serine protease